MSHNLSKHKYVVMCMGKKIRSIAYVTGTRAEFGIVSPLLQKIKHHPDFSLQLYATGMHLMKEYGSTITLVRQAFPEVTNLPARFSSNTNEGMVAFASQLLKQLSTVFLSNRPDVVLVHGDRIEMLAVAMAASYMGIPLLHTQGGDLTMVDNAARHAISKLAHTHFPATAEAKSVLLQLGESKDRVHMVGTLALDTILHTPLMTKQQTLSWLQLDQDQDFVLILVHPVTSNFKENAKQMRLILRAAVCAKLPLVVVYPNADAGSAGIIESIESFSYKKLRSFKNVPYEQFLALEKHAAVWLGNSSAGIVDSPSFQTPVINIGPRQSGRLRSKNIIDVDYNATAIESAIETCLHNKNFKATVKKVKSPWGDGRTSDRIISYLETAEFNEAYLQK